MTTDPGPLPNRWLYCPRICENIIEGKFVAFKTPLSKEFKNKMPIECVFPPEMIFGYYKTLKLKIGLWIDLTNTKRFYDRSIVEAQGAKYVKLQCRGHGETPSKEQTKAFMEIVDSFINDRPLDLIAVHCTHGFNRTGFLIISYLVKRLDYSVDAALSIFTRARPPGIYKQDYINELFKRYQEEDDPIMAPELPDWCLEYDDSNADGVNSNDYNNRKRKLPSNSHSDNIDDDVDDDEVIDDDGKASSSNGGPHKKKKKRRELFIENPKFMEGVTGVNLVTNQEKAKEVVEKVQDFCNWEKSGFPGTQPVSMTRENLLRLNQIPYRVSWKADGTRYMMLVNKCNEIYFIDRNNSCFQVENLTFLSSKDLNIHLYDTLIDGEMVLDRLGNKYIPRFLVYDIVTICGKPIGEEPFYPNRLTCLQKEIVEPRYKAMELGLIQREKETISVKFKEFWDIRTSESLLGESFARKLSHKPDGLIYQPSLQPYTAGVCDDVLKWKPSTMNSVDFLLKLGVESGLGMLTKKVGYLYVGGSDTPFDTIYKLKDFKEYNNKIIECSVNNKGEWTFMRERVDKTLPNSYNTARSVCNSIRYPVTKEILLRFIYEKGYKNDYDRMPPPLTNHVHHHRQQPPAQQQQHHHHHQQQQQHQQNYNHHQEQQLQHHQQEEHHHYQQQQHQQQPPPVPQQFD